jgi:hypothetical protein
MSGYDRAAYDEVIAHSEPRHYRQRSTGAGPRWGA